MKKPPTISTGDQIELKSLLDKAIAVRVSNRRIVETKFGPRPVVNAKIFVLGNNDPLEGVLFQSYFAKDLALDVWYCGILSKDDMRWYLKPAPLKSESALEKLVQSTDDVPF